MIALQKQCMTAFHVRSVENFLAKFCSLLGKTFVPIQTLNSVFKCYLYFLSKMFTTLTNLFELFKDSAHFECLEENNSSLYHYCKEQSRILLKQNLYFQRYQNSRLVYDCMKQNLYVQCRTHSICLYEAKTQRFFKAKPPTQYYVLF